MTRSFGRHRGPGRPLLGVEPLDARLTVMVTRSMFEQLDARAAGRVPAFVRAAIEEKLSGRGRARGAGYGRRRKAGGRRRGVSRVGR